MLTTEHADEVDDDWRRGSDSGSLSAVGLGRREALLAGFRTRLADWDVCAARTITAWADTGLCTDEFVRAQTHADVVLRAAQEHERMARQAVVALLKKERAERRKEEMAANARARMQAQARAVQRAKERKAQASDVHFEQRRPVLSRPAAPLAEATRPHVEDWAAKRVLQLRRDMTLQGDGSAGQWQHHPHQPLPPPQPRPKQPVARRVRFNEPRHRPDNSFEEYSSGGSTTPSDAAAKAPTQGSHYYETEATLPAAPDVEETGSVRSMTSSSSSGFSSAPGDADEVVESARPVESKEAGGVLLFTRARRSKPYAPGAREPAAPLAPNGRQARRHSALNNALTGASTPKRRHCQASHPSSGSNSSNDTANGSAAAPKPQDTTDIFRSSSRGDGAGHNGNSPSLSPVDSRRCESAHRNASVETEAYAAPPHHGRSSTRKTEESLLTLSPIAANRGEIDDLSSADSYVD